jgi:hypothetical protein
VNSRRFLCGHSLAEGRGKAGYRRDKRSSPGLQILQVRLSDEKTRRGWARRLSVRATYHPLVGEYKIRADAAARIEPKMATITRVLGQPCHDGFIAKTVPNLLVSIPTVN